MCKFCINKASFCLLALGLEKTHFFLLSKRSSNPWQELWAKILQLRHEPEKEHNMKSVFMEHIGNKVDIKKDCLVNSCSSDSRRPFFSDEGPISRGWNSRAESYLK